MMHQQFPNFQGLLDPRQGIENHYPTKINGNGATILHVRDSNHFLFTGKYDDKLRVFDSMDNGKHNTVSVQNQLPLVCCVSTLYFLSGV